MITLDDISIRFRGPLLLDGVSAQIQRGDRIGLLGRNGAGKTTLLKMLSGDEQPDHGRIILHPGVRVARLVQDVPQDIVGTVQEIVHRHGSAALAGGKADIDDSHLSPWEFEQRIEQTLSKMDLPPDARFEELSSGMRRRVLLAGSLVSEPDALLLDEPTNHLDIASILWIEQFLSKWPATLIFITHDRAFLQSLATRIWEIDRGRLFDWSCDYQTFLQRKEGELLAEEKQNALFDKKLAQEEVWIRQGIKARRTRNEGRVRALESMRNQRSERRSTEGTAKLNIQVAGRGGALVAKLDNVSFSYGDRVIVRDFSTLIMRGDKIGIIGPNGAGKTTLLKLILGRLKPTSGEIRLGTGLKIAYFDQLRDTLDPEQTVADNVGQGSDRVQIGNSNQHIMGYLQDYLFSPDRARTLVKHLSGGERNRALLARLMTQPANIIVLDEPTNDLDAETLELLEEQIVGFEGTVLMVSHDRTFLNNVVTSTMVFEDDGDGLPGTVNEYDGGYDQWQAVRLRRIKSQTLNPTSPPVSDKTKDAEKTQNSTQASSAKLSFNEKHELKQLPSKIEKLEVAIGAIHDEMAQPGFFQSGGQTIAAKTQSLRQSEADLQAAYDRWAELEARNT